MELRYLTERTNIKADDVSEVAHILGCSKTEAKYRIIEKLNKPKLQYRNQDNLGWLDIHTEYVDIDIEKIKAGI